MAGGTRTTSRARTTATRSAGSKPRSRSTTPQRTKKYPTIQEEQGLLAKAWMGLAHATGAAFRALGPEKLAKEERRDGIPFLLFVIAELSYITYHAGLTHFLFAHIVAEVCDALALVTIAFGLGKRVAPLVPGALQHR